MTSTSPLQRRSNSSTILSSVWHPIFFCFKVHRLKSFLCLRADACKKGSCPLRGSLRFQVYCPFKVDPLAAETLHVCCNVTSGHFQLRWKWYCGRWCHSTANWHLDFDKLNFNSRFLWVTSVCTSRWHHVTYSIFDILDVRFWNPEILWSLLLMIPRTDYHSSLWL